MTTAVRERAESSWVLSRTALSQYPESLLNYLILKILIGTQKMWGLFKAKQWRITVQDSAQSAKTANSESPLALLARLGVLNLFEFFKRILLRD